MTSADPRLFAILEQVRSGAAEPAAAARALREVAGADLGFAVVDHARALRCGFPEVVFCAGKTPADAAAITAEILTRSPRVLLTRCDDAHAAAVSAVAPAAVHLPRGRCITVDPTPLPRIGRIAIVAAGTADLPVAEEARATCEIMGASVDFHADVGVAGLHRLLDRLAEIRRARVVVAVAGMEGALPSVLAGLVARPIVAVPTSTGYGTGAGGLVALATMLNSCAPGVAAVNIDNGFGAGYLAAQINGLA
jgi:hypothetical protein